MDTTISFAWTIVILSLSAVTDVRCRKVYNTLTFPSMFAGILLCGFPCTKESYYRLLWLVIFFFFGQLRLMGMGDLKLCMAVTALRGIIEASWMLLAGGLLLLVYCLFTDRKNTILMLGDTRNTLLFHTPVVQRSDKKYPFALFLAFGYIVVILIRVVVSCII